MKKRTIEVEGYKVDIYDFEYKSFFYPQFNGNAEFEVCKKGFKDLRHYLRTVTWLYSLRDFDYTYTSKFRIA